MSPRAYRKLILGGLVAGLAGWHVIPRLLGASGPRPAHAADSGAPEAEPAAADLALPALPNVEIGAWARDGPAPAAWPEDPFQRRREIAPATEDARLSARPEQPAAFVLNAIISGDTPRALINERVLAVGDRLADGSTVVAIDTFSVALSGPAGTWTLELSE
jgi:hypothetical protein